MDQDVPTYRSEEGILIMSLQEFLLNEDAADNRERDNRIINAARSFTLSILDIIIDNVYNRKRKRC